MSTQRDLIASIRLALNALTDGTIADTVLGGRILGDLEELETEAFLRQTDLDMFRGACDQLKGDVKELADDLASARATCVQQQVLVALAAEEALAGRSGAVTPERLVAYFKTEWLQPQIDVWWKEFLPLIHPVLSRSLAQYLADSLAQAARGLELEGQP